MDTPDISEKRRLVKSIKKRIKERSKARHGLDSPTSPEAMGEQRTPTPEVGTQVPRYTISPSTEGETQPKWFRDIHPPSNTFPLLEAEVSSPKSKRLTYQKNKEAELSRKIAARIKSSIVKQITELRSDFMAKLDEIQIDQIEILKMAETKRHEQTQAEQVNTQEFHDKINLLTKNNEELKRAIDDLRQQNMALKEENNHLNANRQYLMDKINLAEAEIAERKQMTDRLNARMEKHEENEVRYIQQITQKQPENQQTQPKSTLIIQPRKDANTAEVKRSIEKLKKPDAITITKFKTTASNIEIRCQSEGQKDHLRDYLQSHETVASIALTREKTPRRTRMIFPNLHNSIATDEVRKAIIRDFQAYEEDVLVISRTQSHSQPNKANLLIDVTRAIAREMLQKKVVYIDMRPHRCFKYVILRRCMNCHEYNKHETSECTAKTRCPRCAGRHAEDKCTSRHQRCFNCLVWNTECSDNDTPQYTIQDVNHPVYATNCPIYLQERRYRATSL